MDGNTREGGLCATKDGRVADEQRRAERRSAPTGGNGRVMDPPLRGKWAEQVRPDRGKNKVLVVATKADD